MVSVFKYSYPNAKIRAMKGQLLSQEDFRALLQADTFKDVVRVLHMTSYTENFASVSRTDLSTRELTQIVYSDLFQDYKKAIQALQGDTQAFFILLYHQYELMNIKTILRGICGDVPTEQIASLLLPTTHHTLFSKETLLNLRDVHAIIEHLQGTFFQYPLNRALRRFEEEQEFFPLEMALDLHYYQTLWDSMKKLSDEEQRIIRKILGIVVDILNITWIIRFKEEYQFSQEEILNYTIHHGHIFRLRDRRRLAAAKDSDQVVEELKTTPYGKTLLGKMSLNTLRVTLSRYLISELRKLFIGNPFHIGVVLGYLYLKEFEIADIITIAEAKKYGLSYEQSQSYIVQDVMRNA